MNTLKFQRASNVATEQHNLELEETAIVTICGKQYEISVPCNANIVVTDKCPCNCYFCVERQTRNSNRDISSNYIKGLNELLPQLDSKLFEITITGGEPTIDSEKLIQTLKLCHENNLHCRTFSTTGIGFNHDIIQAMLQYGFTHNINVSRMSIDEDENREVFGNTPLTNDDIEKYALTFKLNNAEMRLSCNLINGKVDSIDKILEYVDFYNSIGVDSMLFRELVGCENSILLKDIFTDKHFTYIKTLHNDIYDVDVYRYKDFIVKHYQTKSIKPNKITTLSYNNGNLRIGFTGEKIYSYGKD